MPRTDFRPGQAQRRIHRPGRRTAHDARSRRSGTRAWRKGNAATMAVIVGRTLGWPLGAPAGVHPAACVTSTPAPTARAGAQPRVERTLSGRVPTDCRVRLTPAFGSGPVCKNTPQPKAGLAPVATTQRGDEIGHESTSRPGNDGTGNSAFAGERYSEVWNPPEARTSAPKHAKPSAHKPK